jgi:acyl carrier protein
MDRDAIRAKVQEILRDVMDDDHLVVTDKTVALDVAEWDSTNHVRLMVAIEEEFKIRFESDEITEAENVGELLDQIQSKLRG